MYKRAYSDNESKHNVEVETKKRRHSENESSIVASAPTERYFTELSSGVQANQLFKTQSYFMSYVLRNIDQCPRPEDALKRLFTVAIERAIENGHKVLGALVTDFGMVISCDMLKDPIPIPIAPIRQNTVDSIIAHFSKVDQSAYHGSLMSERIHIRVTTISLPEGGALPRNYRLPYGIHHPSLIDPKSLANNNYCLFAAAELTRLYLEITAAAAVPPSNEEKQYAVTRKTFRYAYDTLGRQHQLVNKLMDDMGLEGDERKKDKYGLSYADRIQMTYNHLYNGRYRLVIFSEDAGGYDILEDATTIASACMRLFRYKYIQKEHVAIVPERGYERHNRQSALAIKYLEWYSSQNGVHVKHAGNGGEKALYGYHLDGYVRTDQGDEYVIEIYGCYVHGCRRCMKDHDVCMNGKTAKENYTQTMQRATAISRVYRIHLEKWECEIREELKHNSQMRAFFDAIIDTGRLDPRHAFSGGRVGPLSLLCTAQEGEEISFLDVVSLYPYTLYTTAFPVGLPELIDCKNQIVNWQNSSQNPYKDHKLDVLDATPVSDYTMRVTYRVKEDFVNEHPSSNIVLALWTTSAARVHLYTQMRAIENTSGCSLLYTDTDSVIFKHPVGVMPVKNMHGGNKQYGLKMIHRETGEEKRILKIRGITLDYKTCQKLHYDNFKEDMVKNFGNPHCALVLDYKRIKVDSKARIATTHETKTYKPFYDKGIVMMDWTCVPPGYNNNNDALAPSTSDAL
uniref:DNA-directed DNA polymerase n=1 Tax=Acrobeloides nanus TaxID=290746 RepID=A0A914DWP8_9BILA